MQTTVTLKSRQRQFVEEMRASGYQPAVVADKPFLRGIRDLGYKDPGHALDELIDNSIEGAAENIAVVFGHAGKSDKKPTHIAVVDDGVGMPAELLRAAVVWGGTDRENSRELFGRYGFGLPSACVSIGERYEVYSKQDGRWSYVPMFLDEIFNGDQRYVDDRGRVVPPMAEEKEPPKWLFQEVSQTFDLNAADSATVVVISNMDRDTYKTTAKWEDFLLEHFGTVYRNFIGSVRLTVNGAEVGPVDPLFLNPKGRHFDDNELRAQELPPLEVPVRYKDDKGNRGEIAGVIKVRFSYLPAGFQNVKLEDGTWSGKNNSRFAIMKDNNGLLFLRSGRQIDVVSAKCPWLTFVNYDRNWKVEIDFPPSLDDEFAITTSKQQVVPSDRIWSILAEQGVDKVITQLRHQFKVDRIDFSHLLEEEAEEREKARTSEEIMEETGRFKSGQPPIPKERQDEAEGNLDEEVVKKAKDSGKPREEIRKELEADAAERSYVVLYERVKGGAFYRPEWFGGQVRLFINQEHPFFTDVYRGPDTSPRMRVAIEMLLFIIGEAELRSGGDPREWYEAERMEWSKSWDRALRFLEKRKSVVDESSADDAAAESISDAENSQDGGK